MHRFRDNQNRSCRISNGRIATLSICPSPGVRSPRVVREDNFMSLGILYFARESQISFVTGCVSNFDVLCDLGNIEYGDRNCERKGKSHCTDRLQCISVGETFLS